VNLVGLIKGRLAGVGLVLNGNSFGSCVYFLAQGKGLSWRRLHGNDFRLHLGGP
jgi:hypothetical protein